METGPFCDLPIEVREGLLSLVQDENGKVTVPDDKEFFEFVQEFGKTYPVLYQLLKLNEEAVRSHYDHRRNSSRYRVDNDITSHRQQCGGFKSRLWRQAVKRVE